LSGVEFASANSVATSLDEDISVSDIRSPYSELS
jgi:hypothetical protein